MQRADTVTTDGIDECVSDRRWLRIRPSVPNVGFTRADRRGLNAVRVLQDGEMQRADTIAADCVDKGVGDSSSLCKDLPVPQVGLAGADRGSLNAIGVLQDS